MAYLFAEILGSLIVVSIIAFILGWILRGLKDKIKTRAIDIAENTPPERTEQQENSDTKNPNIKKVLQTSIFHHSERDS